MTKTNMDLSELLAKQDGGDFLRAVAEAVLQLIMEADVEGLIGAGKHERDQENDNLARARSRAADHRPNLPAEEASKRKTDRVLNLWHPKTVRRRN